MNVFSAFKAIVESEIESLVADGTLPDGTDGARVSVDHEVLRNFLVGGSASYTWNDYEGISREDDDVNVSLFGNYMFNRSVHLRGAYTFTDRDSTVAGSDYQKNILSLQLRGQF